MTVCRTYKGWAPSCAARKPTSVRPRPSPPRRTRWPGSSIPCCATSASTWTLKRNTTNGNMSSGRGAQPSVGRPSRVTSWCQCPMTTLRHRQTDWRYRRDTLRYSLLPLIAWPTPATRSSSKAPAIGNDCRHTVPCRARKQEIGRETTN